MLMSKIGFNLDRRSMEFSAGLRGCGPSERGIFGHKVILQKKDGRSNCQASSTGVIPAESSPILKPVSVGYTVILTE